MKKTIVIAAFVLAAIAAIVGWQMYSKPLESFESAEASAHLSSVELYAAFDQDEPTATQQFVGQVVEVTGLVTDRLENSDGGTTLVLEGDHPIFGVKCRLDPGVAVDEVPDKGEIAVLRGLCIGLNSDVELDRCVIVPTEKP